MTHILNGALNKTKYTKEFIWMYKTKFSEKNLKEKIKRYKDNWSKRNNGCNKIILQCDKSHNVIKEWPSISEIKSKLGYDKDNISISIKYNRLANGYYWKFKNNIITKA